MPHSGQTAAATTICWSAKGGAGTSVVVAALTLAPPHPVVAVDLAGDLPAVFGVPEPAGPGVHAWLGSDAPVAQLHDLSVRVADGITLLPAGPSTDGAARRWSELVHADRWTELLDALSSDDHRVVIDAGTGPPPAALHAAGERSLLVTRPCYLALRRAAATPVRPSAIVLVTEPGRALQVTDVEATVGAPVLATVGFDPAVARAVDAGLLTARLPRVMQRSLRGAA